MPEIKKLELNVKLVTGVTKENKNFEFNNFYVVVNGIECQLKPSDRTVQQIIEKYYQVERSQ